MSRRDRGPTLTGGDYLLAQANSAAAREVPYAYNFEMMIEAALLPPDPDQLLLAVAIAQRPLRDYEACPAAIILGALAQAQARKDSESVQEVVRLGLALLAKWPDYLDTTLDDGHPYFEMGRK